MVHFSVQGNHVHLIVEAPDAVQLGRAMKGLEVRMARALNKVMRRSGPVFSDRYHAHLLRSPRETRFAVRYVLENHAVHALRERRPPPSGVDPLCSDAWRDRAPPLTAHAQWWLLRVAAASAQAAPVSRARAADAPDRDTSGTLTPSYAAPASSSRGNFAMNPRICRTRSRCPT